ncbi:MAG: hypothetical protein ACI8VE_002901, partial [Natrialbaceae archaeon]
MVDTLIEDVQVVRPTGLTSGAIAIADGEIEAVGEGVAERFR